MTKRRRKPKLPRLEEFRPKPGPGQIFAREGEADARHYRNIGASPLLLAFHQGKLHAPGQGSSAPLPGEITADERLDCGEKFEKWWYLLHSSGGGDSTLLGVRGTDGVFFTERQEDAGRQIAWLRTKLSPKNFLIVVAFCGNGHSMLDSLRYAGVEAHPVGTAFRVREALDELVCVLTGRLQVPVMVP